MLSNGSKAFSYIGFAIKSGKLVRGVNSVECEKNVSLILLCKSAAENTADKAEVLKNRFKCPLIRTTDTLLEDIVHKENCKLAAVKDKGLAKAILDNLDGKFCDISGGNG